MLIFCYIYVFADGGRIQGITCTIRSHQITDSRLVTQLERLIDALNIPSGRNSPLAEFTQLGFREPKEYSSQSRSEVSGRSRATDDTGRGRA